MYALFMNRCRLEFDVMWRFGALFLPARPVRSSSFLINLNSLPIISRYLEAITLRACQRCQQNQRLFNEKYRAALLIASGFIRDESVQPELHCSRLNDLDFVPRLSPHTPLDLTQNAFCLARN